jgi:hypothetical protein
MSQSLEVNIKTTSDVPQAMDKAKSATTGFSKQVEDIGKKFSTSFKDIFLGFLAPMVLLQGAISAISAAVEKAKQDARDGLDLIAKGETVYANSEEKKMAAFFKAKKEREEEQRLVKAGILESARLFAQTEDGKAFMASQIQRAREAGDSNLAGLISSGRYKMAADLNPQFLSNLMDTFKRSPEGKAALAEAPDVTVKDTQFKGPEGFGNVIGVGANPVLDAMTRNYEILEQIKDILEDSKPSGGGVPTPFTERLNPASRTTGP